jgi:pSer/pThr/pTyr-binding forkhead associated (FHA) protein
MKCTACGTESISATCVNCGHQASGVDATGTLAFDAIQDSVVTADSLADLPTGAAALVVVRGTSVGETWLLKADVVEVGRSADSELFLDDITVSRKHAVFSKTSSGWTLEDSGSLNGSYVNRELITSPTLLKSGDEIQLGKFRFTFHEGR